MVQAPPETVIRYIRQDVDDDGEEEDSPDHAIWILVGSAFQARPDMC